MRTGNRLPVKHSAHALPQAGGRQATSRRYQNRAKYEPIAVLPVARCKQEGRDFRKIGDLALH